MNETAVNTGGGPGGKRSGGGSTGGRRTRPAEEKPKAPPHSVQRIIKHAELHVEVEKFAEAGIKVNSAVAKYRGFYADSRITQNDDGTTGGYYVIRVPQENFEALYTELKGVGRIKLENAKGDDVTAQFFDLESRIRNAEHMEARLLALLEDKKRHNKLSEILEIERALGEKRREVERLKGQMRLMQDRIQLGTIHLTISEPKRSVPQGSMGVEVTNAAAVDRKIDPLVTGLGGQVSGRTSGKRPDGTGVVKALLRVPMANFGSLVDAVRGMGRVVSEEIKGYNPVAIAADPAAEKVMGTLEIEVFEPPSQKPGGTVNVEVASLADAAKSIGNILDNLKGQLVSRNETRRGATASAHYVVRTPRAKFAELVASLNAVGRIDHKQVIGVDVVTVKGPAAEVPCDLSLNLYERARQAPTATATVSTTDVRKATKAVEALLETVDGHVVSHHEHRTPQGLGSVNYVLRCRRRQFAAMIGGLDTVGRVGAKDVQGLDHEVVTGAAADTLCSLSLKIEERRAPLPGAVLEISAEDAAKASAALKALIDKHGVEPVSVKRTSTLQATLELWKLHVPVKAFDDFVEAVQELGEIKKRQVEGSSAAALEGPDPDALAKVALTLRESRPPLPSATLELVTLDGAEASRRVRKLARKIKADIKDRRRSRGTAGQPVEIWVLRVPVKAFEDFVDDLVELGEIKKREVEGVSPEAEKTLDPKAMAEVSVTLYEKLAKVPTADISIEVGSVSDASKELRSIRKEVKAEVEDRKRLKASDGTAVEHWVLLVPVEFFEDAVEEIEDLGDVKSRDVSGVGAGALGKRDPKAKARIVVAIGQVSPVLAGRRGTFRSTAASAFKTLGYLMAALLWGLIVLVPIFLSLALVLKLVLRIMKPKSGVREVAAAAVTPGDTGAGD
jgi:hypothetical protein